MGDTDTGYYDQIFSSVGDGEDSFPSFGIASFAL